MLSGRQYGRAIRQPATELVSKTSEPNKPWEFDPPPYRHLGYGMLIQMRCKPEGSSVATMGSPVTLQFRWGVLVRPPADGNGLIPSGLEGSTPFSPASYRLVAQFGRGNSLRCYSVRVRIPPNRPELSSGKHRTDGGNRLCEPRPKRCRGSACVGPLRMVDMAEWMAKA